MPIFELDWIDSIYNLMLNDKKNFDQKVQCILLNNLGECIIDQVIEKEDVAMALNFISNFKR